MRKRTVDRMRLYNNILVSLSFIVCIYTMYKYFSYSADCNPINNLPLEVNSMFNLVAMICSYTFWLVPVVVFFWPTK